MYNVELSYKDVVIFTAGPVSSRCNAEALLIACMNKQMIADNASIVEVKTLPEGYKNIEIAPGVNVPIKEALIDDATKMFTILPHQNSLRSIVDTSDENKANAIRMFNDDGSQTEIKLNNVRLAPDLLEVACSPVRATSPTIPTIVEGTLPHSQIPSLYDEGKGYKFDEVSGHEQSDGFGMDDVGVALPLTCAHHFV